MTAAMKTQCESRGSSEGLCWGGGVGGQYCVFLTLVALLSVTSAFRFVKECFLLIP